MAVEHPYRECMECQDAFEKDGIDFKPSYCKYCKTGAEKHKEDIENSDGEKKWDESNWTSHKLKDYYKG